MRHRLVPLAVSASRTARMIHGGWEYRTSGEKGGWRWDGDGREVGTSIVDHDGRH